MEPNIEDYHDVEAKIMEALKRTASSLSAEDLLSHFRTIQTFGNFRHVNQTMDEFLKVVFSKYLIEAPIHLGHIASQIPSAPHISKRKGGTHSSSHELKSISKALLMLQNQMGRLKKNHEERLNEASRNFEQLSEQISNLTKENELYRQENEQIKEWLYLTSLEIKATKQTQLVPISIYLDTSKPEEIYRVYEATISFIETMNFEKLIELKAKKGSWFKRAVAKTKEALTSDEVRELLNKAEYALEVNAVLKQQSEIDKNQSEALLNIVKSVEGIPNAAVRIGSLLVLKITDKTTGDTSVQVRTLNVIELQRVNKHPHLQNNPMKLLELLASESGDEVITIDTGGPLK